MKFKHKLKLKLIEGKGTNKLSAFACQRDFKRRLNTLLQEVYECCPARACMFAYGEERRSSLCVHA